MPLDVVIDGVRYVPAPPSGEQWDSDISLATLIAQCRKLNGCSLDEIADRAIISKTYLWELENGHATNPSLDVAARLAEALGIDLDRMARTLE